MNAKTDKKFGNIHLGEDTIYNLKTCKYDITTIVAYLEHSCDEWVIGNLEKAKLFRDNLNKAIQYMENEQ
jgi:hypothetical protein